MTISNSTAKDKEFYELGKKMFDRLKPLKPIKPYVDPINKDMELLHQINSADIAALVDARETLAAIRESEAAVYGDIIDDSLALIDKALNVSFEAVMERVADRARRNR